MPPPRITIQLGGVDWVSPSARTRTRSFFDEVISPKSSTISHIDHLPATPTPVPHRHDLASPVPDEKTPLLDRAHEMSADTGTTAFMARDAAPASVTSERRSIASTSSRASLTTGSHYPSTSTPALVQLADLAPGGVRSLSAIATLSFILGLAFAFSASWLVYCSYTGDAFFRLPIFFMALSLFHLLEFWTTAAYNTANVEVDSFLLTSNGPAYTIAHTCAALECLVTTILSQRHASSPVSITLLATLRPYIMVAGMVLMAIGQFVRTVAMVEAGASFHHHVQHTKADAHTLVTSGIYSIMRHPSYFGFFWWAIGTQLMLGNTVCLFGYIAVLWKFFSSRVVAEEHYLVKFFGGDYIEYRKRVGTLIPFVR